MGNLVSESTRNPLEDSLNEIEEQENYINRKNRGGSGMYERQAIAAAFQCFIDRSIPGMTTNQVGDECEEGTEVVANVDYKEVDK